jgi:hypothetical protein
MNIEKMRLEFLRVWVLLCFFRSLLTPKYKEVTSYFQYGYRFVVLQFESPLRP